MLFYAYEIGGTLYVEVRKFILHELALGFRIGVKVISQQEIKGRHKPNQLVLLRDI